MLYKIFILFSLFFVQVSVFSLSKSDVEKESDYVIVVSENASDVELYAAKELQHYLNEVSKEKVIITDNIHKEKSITLRYDSLQSKDGYRYYSSSGNIVIEGFGKNGMIYAVYSFLEKELGVHWLTPGCTIIPHSDNLTFANFDVCSVAAIAFRDVFYYSARNNAAWAMHNLLNAIDVKEKTPNYQMEKWWGTHTFSTLLPADKYFSAHPEYFSYYEGKRIRDGQLCLSNPDVINIVTKTLIETIVNNPDYSVYDVSQNDNLFYCQCSKCSKLAKKYGGQSGLMIWFVNKVANNVSVSFPDKKIGTLAYRYTRNVPKNIKPAENVVVRLCTFETCLAHGFEKCDRNKDFLKELKGWSSLSSNICVWDYCVLFKQYIAPFPNFGATVQRLHTYSSFGVKGVFEEGQYESEWGEFSELRQWILSKLLWDPGQNVDSLASLFIDNYYGDAAPDVFEFYKLTQDCVVDNTHVTIYADYKTALYTSEYISKSRLIVDRALGKVRGNREMTKRVNRVAAQIYYLQVTHSYLTSKADGTYDKLKNIIDSDPTYFMEYHKNMEAALKELGYI